MKEQLKSKMAEQSVKYLSERLGQVKIFVYMRNTANVRDNNYSALWNLLWDLLMDPDQFERNR